MLCKKAMHVPRRMGRSAHRRRRCASSTRTAIQRRSRRNAPNLFKGKGCLGAIAEIVSSANAVLHGRRLQEDAPPVGIRKRKVFRERLKSCVSLNGREAIDFCRSQINLNQSRLTLKGILQRPGRWLHTSYA
jgi:hypothetical protein